MLPENRAFMVRGDDGLEYGPVELEELREWVQERRAGLGTEVCRHEPGAQWGPWQDYPELVALLAEAQAGNPAPGGPSLGIAPIWRRILAWFLDLLLLSILFVPITQLLNLFLPMDAILQAVMNPSGAQDLPSPIFHQVFAFEIIANACLVLYFTLFQAAHGKTPAKAILRLRVVDVNGDKPSLIKAFIRTIALVVSVNFLFIPMAYAYFNPQRRTVHDLIAGTYVVEA